MIQGCFIEKKKKKNRKKVNFLKYCELRKIFLKKKLLYAKPDQFCDSIKGPITGWTMIVFTLEIIILLSVVARCRIICYLYTALEKLVFQGSCNLRVSVG